MRIEETYTVSELCEAFGRSRSGYYRWLRSPQSTREIENTKIVGAILGIHARGFEAAYGSPRLTDELLMEGFDCSPNRVARIMKCNGIRARGKRPFRPRTTRQDPQAKFSPNILRESAPPTGPGEQVVGDITYVCTDEGWQYLSVSVDLFSRKVIGWDLADNLDAANACSTLSKASRHTFPGATYHSDRGCQYSSAAFRSMMASLGMRQSMSAKGYCYDNATCESFFATLKCEAFPHDGKFSSATAARRTIFRYIETFYNKTRRHSSLGNISPEAFLKQHHQKKQLN